MMFQFSVFFEDHGFETDEYCDEQGMSNSFTNIKNQRYSRERPASSERFTYILLQ